MNENLKIIGSWALALGMLSLVGFFFGGDDGWWVLPVMCVAFIVGAAILFISGYYGLQWANSDSRALRWLGCFLGLLAIVIFIVVSIWTSDVCMTRTGC